MLAHFQQALADLVASPSRCQEIRDGDQRALHDYELTSVEVDRLVTIAGHRGMAANCTVYRSNRLTPIVINLPDTCAALGKHFREVVDQFWAEHPTEHFVHFLVESDRFARFVNDLPAGSLPDDASARVTDAVTREGRAVRERLTSTTTVG